MMEICNLNHSKILRVQKDCSRSYLRLIHIVLWEVIRRRHTSHNLIEYTNKECSYSNKDIVVCREKEM